MKLLSGWRSARSICTIVACVWSLVSLSGCASYRVGRLPASVVSEDVNVGSAIEVVPSDNVKIVLNNRSVLEGQIVAVSANSVTIVSDGGKPETKLVNSSDIAKIEVRDSSGNDMLVMAILIGIPVVVGLTIGSLGPQGLY